MREIPLNLWRTPQHTGQAHVPRPEHSPFQVEDSPWRSGTAIAIPIWSAGIPVADNRKVIREKSARIAIRTGWTPDLDLIWKKQRNDGFEACFGTCSARCDAGCRYYQACRSLSAEPLGSALPNPLFLGEITERRSAVAGN